MFGGALSFQLTDLAQGGAHRHIGVLQHERGHKVNKHLCTKLQRMLEDTELGAVPVS